MAQNPRTENFSDYRTETYTFKKGKGDSVQFKLKGKTDTLLTTTFYRNGKISKINGRDSIYLFDIKGRIRTKNFGWSALAGEFDSTVAYYSNGNYQEIKSNRKGQRLLKRFTENGQLILQVHEKNDPSVSFLQLEDGNGKIISTERADTIILNDKKVVRIFDTMYYDNGQIYFTKAQREFDENTKESLGAKYYNLDGTLLETDIPDSLHLVAFKDNIDCYYGLKNKRGDTIMKPRFDRIIFSNTNNMLLAYTGDICTLYRLDGTPIPQLSTRLSAIYPLSSNNMTYQNTPQSMKGLAENLANQMHPKYFAFIEESHLYGVMTKQGKIIIPPQYLAFDGSCVGDGRFFSFTEKLGDSVIRRGYLDRRAKPIFSNYKNVKYSGYDDYFTVSIEYNEGWKGSRLGSIEKPNLIGLGRGGVESMVFEPKYDKIQYISRLSLFFVSLKKSEKNGGGREKMIYGIYSPRLNKWLLEANDFSIENGSLEKEHQYFVLQNLKTNKYSIIDTSGKFIISNSMSLDSVGIIDDMKGLFWVKKKGKYHVLEIKKGQVSLHPTGYDYLDRVQFRENFNTIFEEYNYFLAKRNGKWGLINTDESIVKPFEYDYVSQDYDNRNYELGLFLVKNDKATYLNVQSLPEETPDFTSIKTIEISPTALYSLSLADNHEGVFFINDTGKVIIPPQYKQVKGYDNSGYLLVEDAQKNRKIIFTETGKAIDMPFKHQIVIARPSSRIIVVRDSTENTYGVVSTSGKELIPNVNYSIAIGDFDKSIFFVKRDTPRVQRYNNDEFQIIHVNGDSLNIEDKDWIMYDADGKIMDAQSFRFPIDFVKGIGIGMQGDDFNLYKTDGSILTPYVKGQASDIERNFNSIRRIEPNNYYAFYRNQGLTPTMLLTNDEGQILVETGRYDGISHFLGKFTLVSSAGRIGLIDTFGREIIAPQDLLASNSPLIDSLNFNNKVLHSSKVAEEGYLDYDSDFPFVLNTGSYEFKSDSLKISESQRAMLLNLLLQKNLNYVLNKAQNFNIPRSYSKVDGHFFYYDNSSSKRVIVLKRLAVAANTISFTWSDADYSDSKFYNFKKINDRWVERSLYDILDLQSEKLWALNDLLTKKIKALKDISIDCSNSSAFVKQIENSFMLTEKGIDFCFESDNYGDQLVVIPFTFEELKPFLR